MGRAWGGVGQKLSCYGAATVTSHMRCVRMYLLPRQGWSEVGVGWGENLQVELRMSVLTRHAWGGIGVGWGKNVHVTLCMYGRLPQIWVGLG